MDMHEQFKIVEATLAILKGTRFLPQEMDEQQFMRGLRSDMRHRGLESVAEVGAWVKGATAVLRDVEAGAFDEGAN